MRKITRRDIDELYAAILTLESRSEAQKFFRDLLTETEIRELAERWKTARLLDRGMPYTRIIEETGISSTTVARVARWLRRGAGGYRLVLRRSGRKGA